MLFVDHVARLSGGQLDLLDLVRALGDRVEAHIALPGPGPLADSLTEAGATIHQFPLDAALGRFSRWELARRPQRAARLLRDALGSAFGLVRLVRTLRPDIVHTNSMKAHLLAAPAARLTRTPLIWHVRDILQEGWLQRLFVALAGILPTRVLAISHATALPFGGGRAGRRTRVVYNGVQPAPVEEGARRSRRAALGADDTQVLVAIVGQIADWKGQDVFIDAAASVAAAHDEARFAIVGSCLFPENERDFEAAQHERVIELGLDGRLVWAGQLEPIEPVMAALDVFVHASRLPEPFGRVIVEAMAQGTPVITTSIGAGPELVEPDTGFVIAPGDARALAAAVNALLEDPGRRAAMGTCAERRAAAFSIEATASGVLDTYASLE